MELPVENRIVLLCEQPVKNDLCSSPFGIRAPIDGLTKSKTFHHGVDLRLFKQKVGFDVRIVIDTIGTNPYAGNYLVAWVHPTTSRPAIRLFLCHLSKIFVEPKEVVAPHRIIAITGNSGSYTSGYHLHLGTRLRCGGAHSRSDLSIQNALDVGFIDPADCVLVLEAFISNGSKSFSSFAKTFDRRHQATELSGPALS